MNSLGCDKIICGIGWVCWINYIQWVVISKEYIRKLLRATWYLIHWNNRFSVCWKIHPIKLRGCIQHSRGKWCNCVIIWKRKLFFICFLKRRLRNFAILVWYLSYIFINNEINSGSDTTVVSWQIMQVASSQNI